jgi:hypothetical protein
MADEEALVGLLNPNFFEYFSEGAPAFVTDNHSMLLGSVNGAMHIVNSTGKQSSYDAGCIVTVPTKCTTNTVPYSSLCTTF